MGLKTRAKFSDVAWERYTANGEVVQEKGPYVIADGTMSAAKK